MRESQASITSAHVQYIVHNRIIPDEMKPERVPSHDLTFVREGEMVYFVSGECFTACKGEVMYCPRGGLRERPASLTEAYYTSINFIIEPEQTLPLPFHITASDSSALNYYLNALLNTYTQGGNYASHSCDLLLELIIYELLKSCALNAANGHVQLMKSYIQDNYTGKLTLDMISAFVHLYPTYCGTLFKQSEGISIHAYINRLRLNHAARLLRLTTLPASDIAEQTGYCDSGHFCHAFVKYCGMTPSAYRRCCVEAPVSEKRMQIFFENKDEDEDE